MFVVSVAGNGWNFTALVVWLVVVEQAVGVRVAEFVVEIGNGDHNLLGRGPGKVIDIPLEPLNKGLTLLPKSFQ